MTLTYDQAFQLLQIASHRQWTKICQFTTIFHN